VPSVDLRLPEPERRLAAALASAWRDLLYVPGPGFTSPLDPGVYRSSFVIALAAGAAVRLSSLIVPAFGTELCRLRLEPLERHPAERLGSFFEPARTGAVHALTGDRLGGAARPPDRAEWRYEGPALVARLGRPSRVRLLREVGRGAGFSWQADRGIVITTGDGDACLLLGEADPGETASFLPTLGLHRALLDPSAELPPGVSVRGLLGYGEWDADVDVTVELRSLPYFRDG